MFKPGARKVHGKVGRKRTRAQFGPMNHPLAFSPVLGGFISTRVAAMMDTGGGRQTRVPLFAAISMAAIKLRAGGTDRKGTRKKNVTFFFKSPFNCKKRYVRIEG